MTGEQAVAQEALFYSFNRAACSGGSPCCAFALTPRCCLMLP
jgi:hypothetical protein